MAVSRRNFMIRSALATAGGLTVPRLLGAENKGSPIPPRERPLLISTWPFGKAANDAALKVVEKGGTLLDAVEQGIGVVESDASNASVGLGGTPNSAGVVQLDACIMYGPGHKAGSVAAIEGIRHPISVARRVMEKTRHVMLVGDGARQFAVAEGFEWVEPRGEAQHQEWLKWKAQRDSKPVNPGANNHDTIALLVLGADGTIAGGCSTSGLGRKLPGRVGDSPIIGSGLYVDNEVGAAGATGLGENVMRYCGSFLVVEYMRQGLAPEEACVETIKRIARQDPRGTDLSINFVALDKQGRYGAAGTGNGFSFSVTSKEFSKVLGSAAVSKLQTEPERGSR